MNPIESYFSTIRSMGCRLPRMFEFIEQHGQSFIPQELPAQYQPMQSGRCFENAFRMACIYPELTYVEGIAQYIIPVEHAWVVDKSGRVIDPTWPSPGSCYVGIPMRLVFVVEAIIAREFYGVFDSCGGSIIYEKHPTEFLQSIAIGEYS